MLVQLNEKGMSRARLLLKKHTEQRNLVAFLREGLPDLSENDLVTIHASLYKVLVGQRVPSANQIFMCRSFIQPCLWFYTEDEKLPRQTRFTAKHDFDALGTKLSLGKYKLLELCRTPADRAELAKTVGLPVKKMIYMTVSVKNLDKPGRHYTYAPFESARLLKNFITPDLWYIFPDEVKRK